MVPLVPTGFPRGMGDLMYKLKASPASSSRNAEGLMPVIFPSIKGHPRTRGDR